MELAKKFLPLGILLDIQLPVKSGWEVMDALKSDPVTRPIPVHVISSYQVKIRSLSKGAVDFINKPVTFEKLGEIFRKIEKALSSHPKKVLIIEENTRHAQALAYFLESYQINAEIKNSVDEEIKTLNENVADCVILDIGISAQQSYEILEEVKQSPGLENIPVIVFTRTNLSQTEEMKIKQYADSIVIKTAHSYERILGEVSLFLHLVEENKKNGQKSRSGRLGELSEVLTNKTILVVDDVRNIFSLIKTLESYGMNVISAIDGKDALTQLQENDKVDLILMDMMMPEMDGYDFTNYARASLKRRVQRLLVVDRFPSFAELVYRVKNDPDYLKHFVEELTVNVIEMFRDPCVFKTIREQILPVLATYPLIRIWHTGCATGEEVYSMAILLEEANLLHKSRLYATDLNPAVIENIRRGIFPMQQMKLYSENYIL
jgi:CheY-like chemotaxis protein